MGREVLDLNEFLERVQNDKELLLELLDIFVEDFQEKRKQMVYDIRVKYGLKFSDVASVMLQIPREKLVPKEYKNIAYRFFRFFHSSMFM